MHELLQRIERLNDIGIALSAEHDPARLLEIILHGAKELTNADGGSLYLVHDDAVAFEIMSTNSLGIELGGTTGEPIPFDPLPLHVDGRPNESMVVTNCVLSEATINIPDAYDAEGYDFSGTRAFDNKTGYRTQSLLTVPMRDHEETVIGVLQLINAIDGGEVVAFDASSQKLAESLGSQAAIALTNKQLLDDLQELFESFVRLIAEAIDEKSPYTGAHCRRVPELTMMLADAAHRADSGPLSDFRMSAEERYALNIAGWLHDCGKITTPEHVMDKSTKLHTVRDGIEEVAARFAALRAEVRAAHAQRIAAARAVGDEVTAGRLEQACEQELAALGADLEFLRRANLGGESMADADCERVAAIAQRSWTDSEGETRPLLTEDEVENLCIRRGTLNDQERQVIENHMVATIRMLEQLPFPRHLQKVPEYAAGHHERVDGTGYPRGLTREEMSVPARVMAIADIFEALSAADRPYKKAKPLSECLQIMGQMCVDGHIDPDLFRVFVERGVYREYGERFLLPEQLDEVDPASIPGLGQRRRAAR
ncbi:MAG: HD domain-containing phosphohydrolase [Halofilum sp. (in: g-proteobacteria)]|nr:HD domain-containing phosphohydrolase [Halofilum sp. (in: g-proteobacteria)]